MVKMLMETSAKKLLGKNERIYFVKKVTETGHRIIDDHYFQEYIMVLLRSILFYIVTEHYYPNTQCIE